MRNALHSLFHSTRNTNATSSNPTSGGSSSSERLFKVATKKTKTKLNLLVPSHRANTPLKTSYNTVSVGNSNDPGPNEGLSASDQTENEGHTGALGSPVVEVDDIPEPKPFAIDSKVLKQLYAWQKENPDNRLTSVLQKVSTAMESGVFKAALKAIPSGGPVPVGAIIECVAAIVLVGIKTRERKHEALEFAMRVVGDLDALANALGESSPNKDPLWDQCKDDLQPFCDTANEVCQWALEQLQSRLALSTDELVTLERKMENANASFMRLLTIRMLRALSRQSQDILGILQFIERRNQLDRIGKDLAAQSADTYLYSEQGKQDCHPGTRDVVLGMLDKWLWEHSTATGDYLQRCWWITGVAGVGKTAIAISAIHQLLDRKRLVPPHPSPNTNQTKSPILAAQYFFNHKIGNSAQLGRLFPTLALQIAQVSLVAACIIQKTLTNEPSIVNRFSLGQAEKLFLDPFRELCNLYPEQSIVVVIDGLDELVPLSGEGKEHCYGLVTKVLVQLAEQLPRNAGLVILSRPETEFMDNIPNHIPNHIHRYHLDTKAVESRDAVQKYFADELPTICRYSGFPSKSQLEALCTAADGHLGWAKGAKSWLWSFFKTSVDPNLRDQAIADLARLTPGDLPELYRHMLAGLLQRVDQGHQLGYRKNLHSVLSILTVLREPQRIGTICGILQFDARGYLDDLSGLYADGTKSITDETVPQPHKSFYDFLVSDKLKRDLPALHVDLPMAHQGLASRCFQIMQSDLHFNMGCLQSPDRLSKEAQQYARSQISGHVRYACTSFMQHIQSPFGEEVMQWITSTNFLFWLEVMVISSEDRWHDQLSPAANVLHTLQNLYPEMQTLIQPSITFATTFRESFKNNPFLIYLMLPFSPSSFQPSCLTRHITIKSRQDGWVGTGRHIPCTISPNGEFLAILSQGQLSLLSVGSSRPIWEHVISVLMQDSSYLTFSEDGTTIIVVGIKNGSSVVNVILVDTMSGDVVKEVVLRTLYCVYLKHRSCISLSPGGAYIALWIESQLDSYLYLYRDTGGPSLMKWTIGDCAIRWLNGEYLLIFGPGRASVVKATTQELVVAFEFPLNGEPIGFGDMLSIAYYEGGDVLVAGLPERIGVWKGLKQLDGGIDIKGTMLQPEYYSVAGFFVTACCFSPDGKHLALSSTNWVIQVWSCRKWIRIATLYGLVDNSIVELSFRRNGKQLVSRSEDGTVQIWDISAIVEGQEHAVKVEEGALVMGGWFKHGIQLGGFFVRGEGPEPFICDYPFELPEGVDHLNWEIKDLKLETCEDVSWLDADSSEE